MALFPRTSKWESQNWDFCYSKTLDSHIFFKSNPFLACEGNILYPSKKLSNGVLYTLIGDNLTPSLRGFVIGSQVSNLTLDLSFDHNSCISNLSGQCEGTLNI